MRIVIEGNLTQREAGDLVRLLKTQDQAHPERVCSLVFEEHGWSEDEFMEFCHVLGLDHTTVVPVGLEAEMHFEKGGGVRIIPFDGDGPTTIHSSS